MKDLAVAINEFTLPDLNFTWDALEPYIDKETMQIHYSKHHKGYVDKLNRAVQKLESEEQDLEKEDLEKILRAVSLYNESIRNNGGGHYNHSFFWSILTPTPIDLADGPLKNDINKTFGSVEKFKEKFLEEATSRFGSGWAWLVVDPNGKLEVGSTPNQDSPIMDVSELRGTPILGLDVWEHAYYLTYQNKRAEYVDAFWNIVNWDEVNKRYTRIKSEIK